MQFVGIFFWWYSRGFLRQTTHIWHMLARCFDFFSIDLLAKTLFSPFRQISAGKVRGPLAVQLRAWFDGLVSRVIGAVVRLFTMIAGLIVLLLVCVFGAVYLLLWISAPLWPIAGLTLTLMGWIPWAR